MSNLCVLLSIATMHMLVACRTPNHSSDSEIQSGRNSTNRLSLIELNQEKNTVKVCATAKIFTLSKTYSHPDYRGYVIRQDGDGPDLSHLDPAHNVCLSGSYAINSRGFAPHLILSNLRIEDQNQFDVSAVQFFEPVAASSAHAKAVKRISNRWADERIFSGVSMIKAQKTKGEIIRAKLSALALTNFRQEVAASDFAKENESVKVTSATNLSIDEVLNQSIEAIAAANNIAGANRQARLTYRKDLTSLLKALGDINDVIGLVSSTKLKIEEAGGAKLQANAIVFINVKTQNAVRIFCVDSW